MKAPLDGLERLTNDKLRKLLRLIGCSRSGAKSDLATRLNHYRHVAQIPYDQHGKARILSVDMGIRNLAYCVADIQSEAGKTARSGTQSPQMSVIAWDKVDLSKSPTAALKGSGVNGELDLLPNAKASVLSDIIPPDPWSPRNIALLANSLLRERLLPYKPDLILIERQRFRSGGGPAVFEWTLRVNMLESMLWASLMAMNAEKRGPGAPMSNGHLVCEASPQNVTSFWTDPAPPSLAQTLQLTEDGGRKSKVSNRYKITKNDKVGIVQNWLSSAESVTEIDTGLTNTSIHLGIGGDAEATSRYFLQKANKTRPKVSKKKGANDYNKDNLGKIDDLADCLLQATAWVAWETNRQQIANMEIEDILRVGVASGS